MKSFREHILSEKSATTYPASYEKNPILIKLADKHNDPFKFVLDVLGHMIKGKLKLKRIGVANTREVVAFWNDRKKQKIDPALVEEFISEIITDNVSDTLYTVEGFLKTVETQDDDTTVSKRQIHSFNHNGHDVRIMTSHDHDNPHDHEVSFSVGRRTMKTGDVGVKNTRGILKKVSKIVRLHARRNPKASISFTSDEFRTDRDPSAHSRQSRTKIYKRLANRLAKRRGLKVTTRDHTPYEEHPDVREVQFRVSK